MDKLRLFVVGQSVADPEHWSPWFDRAIVVAHDETEAMALSGLTSKEVAEIHLDKPTVLEIRPSDADRFTT